MQWTLLSYGILELNTYHLQALFTEQIHIITNLNIICCESQQKFVFTGLCSIFSLLLWLLQQPANSWLAQIPYAPLILSSWCTNIGL